MACCSGSGDKKPQCCADKEECCKDKQKCCRDKQQQQQCCEDDLDKVHDSVKHYFGKEMKTRDDCLTGVNCLVDQKMAPHIRQALAEVHEEVTMK